MSHLLPVQLIPVMVVSRPSFNRRCRGNCDRTRSIQAPLLDFPHQPGAVSRRGSNLPIRRCRHSGADSVTVQILGSVLAAGPVPVTMVVRVGVVVVLVMVVAMRVVVVVVARLFPVLHRDVPGPIEADAPQEALQTVQRDGSVFSVSVWAQKTNRS